MAKILTANLPGNRTSWCSDWDAYLAVHNRLCPWSVASGAASMYGSYGISDAAPTGIRGAVVRETHYKTGQATTYAQALANAQASDWYFQIGQSAYARGIGYWSEDVFTASHFYIRLVRYRFKFLMPPTGRIRLRYRIREGAYLRYPVTPSAFIVEPTWVHHSIGYRLPQLSETIAPRPKDSGGSCFCSVRMEPVNSNKDLDYSSLGYSVSGCEANVVSTPISIVAIRAIGDLVRESPATLTIEADPEDATGGGATAEFRQGKDGLYYPVLTNPGSGWTRMPILKVNDVAVTKGYYLLLSGGVVSEVNLVTGGNWNHEPEVVNLPTNWLGSSTPRWMTAARVVVDTETDDSIIWEGSKPVGYDPNDPDTWPATDWIELPTPAMIDSVPVGAPGESTDLRGEFFYALHPAVDLDWGEE